MKQKRPGFKSALASLGLSVVMVVGYAKAFSRQGFELYSIWPILFILSACFAAYSLFQSRKNEWLSLEGRLAIIAALVCFLMLILSVTSMFVNF